MADNKALKTDLGEIAYAMEDNSLETRNFLNLKSGEIVFVSEDMDTQEKRNIYDEIDEDSHNYEEIPKIESREAYGDMEDFIETLQDEQLARVLTRAISGRGAFRMFKQTLEDYPEERKRWFAFKDERTRQRVLEWLDEIGVELVEG